MMKHILSQKAASEFIFSGNALFTLRNGKTGVRFTYKISCRRDEINSPSVWFVKVRVGSEYKYSGFIKKENKENYIHSRKKSELQEGDPAIQNLNWVIANINRKVFPETVQIWHEGKCGRCGRTLTDPESITRGIGPECMKKIKLK